MQNYQRWALIHQVRPPLASVLCITSLSNRCIKLQWSCIRRWVCQSLGIMFILQQIFANPALSKFPNSGQNWRLIQSHTQVINRGSRGDCFAGSYTACNDMYTKYFVWCLPWIWLLQISCLQNFENPTWIKGYVAESKNFFECFHRLQLYSMQ